MPKHKEETAVLVVGGGLVGLTTALFLQQHNTPFILIEREQAASPLPRARGWAVRSMELFRSLGLQSALEIAAKEAWEQGVFGGARRGPNMLASEALEIPSTKVLTGNDPSPCHMVACPQTAVEPILRRALEERGGTVHFGVELLSFTQDNGGIQATIRNQNGAEQQIDAQFLVAADGSRGTVRRQLKIDRQSTGGGTARHYLNIFFEADLADRMRNRTFSQCEVNNDTASGLFLSMNNTTRWSFHLLFNPDTEQPETWSNAELTNRLHAAICNEAAHQVPLTIHHKGTWTAVDRVADHYRDGRIFLVGDTAHIMPPWGGLNGNTGIADAHNLAWKLARAVRQANDATTEHLLASYESERRPVALRNGEQAQLRTNFEARFGIRTDANEEAVNKLRDGGELLMRYRYGQNDTVEKLEAQEGTRFPHASIEVDGKRQSTLDLFGSLNGTILAGPKATQPTPNTLQANKDFHFLDEGVTWHSLTGSSDETVIEIRPDGFVAAHHAH
ncbi:MAG: FAD-dependent monooxygenase [Rhodospirillales bacterium]|nr:FAD-dependent monooxygenase [Acetobacter sp.]